MTLKKKLTKWKRRLLDVGKRNRLINFRKSIASTVEIIADDFYKLYDDFMDSNLYEFAKLFDTVGDFDGAFEESLDQKLTNALGKTIYYKDRYEISEINEIRKRFKPNPKKNYLYSTTIYQRLNYVLNNLSKKGRLYYEENGVNALYMAFGFLSYIEDGQEFLAPLALVPIEISQRSVADPFKVRPLDDDFIINDNIVHKFKLDYKIDLGRLDGEELKKYLTSVNAKVAKLNFKVINSVYIGLFSFSKIMMYQDILNNEDKITKSPVVRALVGLDTTLNQNIKLDEVNLDKAEGLEEQNQVLAADSSQYKAIYYAKEGLSFVLQGPPGTGKSQTITNMLAELIAKNKKVLFVCEKKSALEVVYRNLKKCSLDMYALPLFDTKANKKDIVKGIYDNLNSVQNNRIKVSDKARDDMATDENLMMKMNQYLEEILTKIEPINMSIYDLVSKISGLSRITSMSFTLENPLLITNKMIDEYIEQIEIFSAVSKRLGDDPKSHPFYLFNRNKLTKKDEAYLKDKIIKSRNILGRLMDILKDTKNKFNLEINDIKNIDEIVSFMEAALILKDVAPTYLELANPSQLYETSVKLEKIYDKNKELRDYLIKKYKLSFLDLDIDTIYKEMHEYQSKVKRMFGYKKLDTLLEGYLLNPKNMKYEEEIEDLKKLKEYKDGYLEAKRIDITLAEKLPELYFGTLTDFYELNRLLYALKIYDDGTKSISVSSYKDFLELLKKPENEAYLILLVNKIKNIKEEIENSIDELNDYFDYDLKEENPLILNQRLNMAYIYFDRIYEYIDFINSYQRLDKRISSFKKECLKLNIKPDDYKNAFLKHYYELCLNEYLGNNSRLDIYSGAYLNNIIAKYQEIDGKMKEISKIKIKEQVTKSWPELNSVMASNLEVKTLLSEANKKRKLKTLRILFKEIPTILMNLKPIFMMSPLSVATYLDSDTFHFDCVIFDEASQITSENAVGAMYRANQIIIVGDNEQLPPTSFFDMSFDDEDDEEAEYEVYESILDEALTSLPKIMLKWHYRSKDESLITFSNKEIYHDLTTFPSCIKNDHLGLHYEFVPNGLYIHGKRINEAEGRKVVDLVMEIAKNNPAKSLGVVTFNMAQQSYIERLIHRERLKNQDCEEFFSEEREEPFFVKNLESVQGDERDIIIISSTFGPDSTGKLSLNFGPINKDGGYRRLNVAITRAKERVILATSLSPDMFNLSKTTNKGVIMLHDYIAFASNIKSSEFKENQTDNGMISSIARFLEEHEYKTVRNIGYSGYKIDLAVLDSNDPKHVILGILTDGENYQHLKTVKDRNSLIDNALSLRGWSLYHVWSLSYYKNPELYHNEIINILAHGEENHEECYNDADYECEDSSNSITIDSLFMSYPDALKIITDAIHNEHSKEDAILKIIYELAPIRILDLKKLILPMYGKSRLTLNLEHEMEVELDKIISENGLHKVIGFVLKPSDLYGVDFRMYKSDLYYPKIDGIYVEELEDGFKRVIKHVKTTSKRILYSEFNTLVGYPKGSSQTKVYFDRVIDILSDKGIIEVNKDIIDYKEV